MLVVQQISIQAGDFLVDAVDLSVAAGEYFVLMGQTGSGKSLLVKAIAGLIQPLSGTVSLDGRGVSSLPPRKRNIGYVPQDGLLFPHMDVAHNITFPLRQRRCSHHKAMAKVQPVLQMLELEPLLARQPRTLSGGETQKVAVARALASQPDLLILDEPVSALDEPSRREVCEKLLRVQKKIRVSTVHICHSLEEARAMADRVGIMAEGKLVQCGPLDKLQSAPAHPAVERLFGGVNL